MNTIIKFCLLFAGVVGIIEQSCAQQATAAIVPYSIDVTYFKTTHLLFPSSIRYVDLGSEYLIASKVDDAKNVLRVKASVTNFTGETNFSVITEDGKFYNFNVHYNASPAILNYDIGNGLNKRQADHRNEVLFEDLGNSSPSVAGLITETIYKKNRRVIKHIGSQSYGIQFLLKGIYVHNDQLYFHTELRNRSNVPFTIDFMNFKVVDKKVAKRTVVQEQPLTPLRMYKRLGTIGGNTVDQNVFLLDQLTIADDKVLMIEIFEKNGSRQQTLQVENSDLVHAKLINGMRLKIN